MNPEVAQLVTVLWQAAMAAIGAVVVVLTPFVVWCVKRWTEARVAEIYVKIDPERREIIDTAIRMAVQAAEQSGLVGLITDIGAEKKAYALKVAQEYLNARHVKLNLIVISALIEQAIMAGIQNAPADWPDNLEPVG